MSREDLFDRQLFALTTIIIFKTEVNGKEYSGNATGFYYTELAPRDPEETGPQWLQVNGQWLITNKHVIFPMIDGTPHLIDELVFCLRKETDSLIEWVPIKLNRGDILSLTKLHKNEIVDVVAIDVSKFIVEKLQESIDAGYRLLIPGALSNNNLPDNQPLVVDVTTDIVVASYPKGFYDDVNKFPIVKSGIVASGWGLHFKGLPQFEIDAQLFPGSSGGLVISKPTNAAVFNNAFHSSITKQFVFLGVYSGEYTWNERIEKADGRVEEFRRSYGLGNVWYSYLIPEIISSGHQFNKDS